MESRRRQFRGRLQSAETDRGKHEGHAQKEFGTKADEFLKLYPATTTRRRCDPRKISPATRFIAWSTWRWLEAQSHHRHATDLSLSLRPWATLGTECSGYGSVSLGGNRICVRTARSKCESEMEASGSSAQRVDAEVLVKLRPQRRSERSRPASVAGVRGGKWMEADVSGCEVGCEEETISEIGRYF